MSQEFPSSRHIEIDWPTSERALEYRLILWDLETDHKRKVNGESPRFVIPIERIDLSHRYEWRIQHRDAHAGSWRDLSPYLLLPRPTGPSETQTLIQWSDRGAPAYRVLIRDVSLGEIAIKAGVRGAEYILDWSTLDMRHAYSYRLQAWLEERWCDVTKYTPLPRTPQGKFDHRVVVEYRDPKAFNRQAFASIPANRLEGIRLESGWTVKARVRSVTPRGGIRRDATYLADHPDSGEGFLKAFDFSAVSDARDPTSILQNLTKDYEDECRQLEWCAAKGVAHVVRSLDRGIHTFPSESVPVPYIVYERAATDLDIVVRDSGAGDTAWVLRVLQQVATGLNELHREGLAHLDIKAANILIFDDGSAKIADFDMARHQHDEVPIGLLPARSIRLPPEWLYRPPPPYDWRILGQGCDLYSFGSLIRYLFSGTSASATPALLAGLDLTYHPHSVFDYWSALPFIREAFDRVVREFEDAVVEEGSGDLVAMFRELCDPDPYLRGDPRRRGDLSEQYSLEGYVRRLGLLARRADAI